MQCERRNQVEPRCAERWHLRDDEQFDLAAWFLFTLETELVTCGQLLLYLDIAFAVKDTDYFAQNEEKGEKLAKKRGQIHVHLSTKCTFI